MGFGPIELSGRLLIATDGLFKYATESYITQRATALSVNDAVDKLIAGLRLLSGALQDDVAIILIEASSKTEPKRRKMPSRILTHNADLPNFTGAVASRRCRFVDSLTSV